MPTININKELYKELKRYYLYHVNKLDYPNFKNYIEKKLSFLVKTERGGLKQNGKPKRR